MSFKSFLFMFVALGVSTNSYAHRPGFYKIDNRNDAQVVFHKSGLKCSFGIEGAEEKEGYFRLFVFSDAATEEYSYESGYYVEVHFKNDRDEQIEHYVKVDYYDSSSNVCVISAKKIKLFAEDGKLGNFGVSYDRELPPYVKQ